MRYAMVAAAAFLAGCGYVGDPKPPSLGIPEPPSALTVRQVGNQLIGDFQFSGLATDKVALQTVDGFVRIGEREVPITTKPGAPGHFSVASTEWSGQDVRATVHLRGPRGRWSDASNEVALHVEPPVAAPRQMNAALARGGVALTWEPATPALLLRRVAGTGDFAVLTNAADLPPYTDSTAGLGQRYEYRAQARRGEALSEPGPVAAITFEDRFAPAVPQGLDAVAGITSIELTWDLNDDADFAGFLIYRATGNGEFTRLAGPQGLASYSDRSVKPGTTYRYAVTAVDRAGNESVQSKPAEISASEQ